MAKSVSLLLGKEPPKWMKLAGVDGFSSAVKMKSRVLSNFMGAINLILKPVEQTDGG
jgi:hypothetical protein